MTFRMLSKSVAIVFVVLLGLCRVFAQSGQADVAGTVKRDGSGATVPNAKVTLTNTDSGTIRSLTVQSDGQYDFPDVAPGHYSISVEATSFVPETVKGLTIELGAHVRQDISLRVGNAERIEVNGEVSTIDATAANDVGGVDHAKPDGHLARSQTASIFNLCHFCCRAQRRTLPARSITTCNQEAADITMPTASTWMA